MNITLRYYQNNNVNSITLSHDAEIYQKKEEAIQDIYRIHVYIYIIYIYMYMICIYKIYNIYIYMYIYMIYIIIYITYIM